MASSSARNPATAAASYSRAIGMRRATCAFPLAVSLTTTSRVLLAERVRVTTPIRTSRVTMPRQRRDFMLVRSARSICRWPPLARQHGHHPPHGDAQPIRRQHLAAVLIGNDGADAIYQVRQIIVEIELGGLFHAVVPRTVEFPESKTWPQVALFAPLHCVYNRCILNYHPGTVQASGSRSAPALKGPNKTGTIREDFNMSTYVLVHGAWHTGAELEPTAAPIRAAGHDGPHSDPRRQQTGRQEKCRLGRRHQIACRLSHREESERHRPARTQLRRHGHYRRSRSGP